MTSARMGRTLQAFYATIIFSTMALLAAGTWWFWSQGPSHGSRVAEVYEAGLTMDRLSDTKQIEEIENMVASDRVRMAVKKLAAIEAEAQSVGRVVEATNSEQMKEASAALRTQMHRLIEFPELSSIFLVLANKMASFENYVVQNEWRTLTRLSRRVNARLEPAKLRSPGFFQYSKLVQTVGGVREDISQMRTVTTNSVLSQNDKNSILSRLSTMDSEIDMLGRYVETYQAFSPAFTKFKNAWGEWTDNVSPGLTKIRLEQERASQWILYGVVGLFTFLMLGLVVGMAMYKREQRKMARRFEREMIHVIRDRMLPTDGSEDAKWSRDFALEFTKYREYVHKRMSFGTIFQEATPFGAFLLDSNLGVVWTNDLFWNCWNLEKQNDGESNMTWDYLQGFTNLGEDDPVMMALRQGIAGIYQIQIKAQGEEETAPYEMYVSPVDYAGQTRIMIFLYPLRTVEESLAQQTKAIVGPAVKALEAIATREFEGETRTRLETQFASAGIDDLFGQFTNFDSKIGDRLSSLEGEIKYLREELTKTRNQMSEVADGARDGVEKIDSSVTSFEAVKESVIASIDYRYEIERFYADTVTTAKALFKDEEELLTGSITVQSLLNENQKAANSVAKVREQLKTIKREFDEGRSRLSQSVDQALVFAKRDQNGGTFEAPLHKIKGEVRAFDQAQAGLGQALTSLDVSLSKMEMILEDHQTPDFALLKRTFEEARARIEGDMFRVGKLAREGEMRDEKVVGALKRLFGDFQSTRKQLNGVRATAATKQQLRDNHVSVDQ